MVGSYRGPSWAAIIVWFITFWPVGLYLMIKKLTTDREAAVRRERKAPFMGWVLLCLGLFFFSSFSGSGSFWHLMWALFFICGGLSSLSTSKRGSMEGERFRSYINAIVNHGLTYIGDIAAFAQVHERQVVKDLKKMIRMGYFDHAHIDDRRGEIYLYQRHAHVNLDRAYYDDENEQVRSAQDGDATAKAAYAYGEGADYGRVDTDEAHSMAGTVEKLVNCRNCGAQNWITPGTRNTCEYCGSVLT